MTMTTFIFLLQTCTTWRGSRWTTRRTSEPGTSMETSRQRDWAEQFAPSSRVSGKTNTVFISFVDPRHFGTDPDSRIRTTNWRIRIRILLFLSVTFKKSTKFFPKFFLFFLLFEGTFTSFFTDKKSQKSHNTIEIKVLSYYLCLMMEGSGSGLIRSNDDGNGSGTGRSQNITYGSGSRTTTLVLKSIFMFLL